MKVGLVASSGGHWEELMQILDAVDGYEVFFVTEKGGQSEDCNFENLYLFEQINRKEKLFALHFIYLFVRAFCILLKEKADVIITTGALLSFPFCVAAKILAKKVVYIESFARVNDRSLTGKLVYKFADLFIVQWKSMLEYYPNATYTGGIF